MEVRVKPLRTAVALTEKVGVNRTDIESKKPLPLVFEV